MSAWYNENDPYAAQWLRNLIAGGHIAPGVVDERSVADVQPGELDGYDQCHFFAGVGGWSLALRLALWPDGRPVWTGSCPCQPFSAAGKRRGAADERHLWPHFHRLIAGRKPAVVLGEQVASKDGRAWLAGVRADLEGLGYAVGAADLCAAGVGAPHIRQRLWWVADADQGKCGRFADGEGCECDWQTAGWQQGDGKSQSGSIAGGLADADGRLTRHGDVQPGRQHGQQPEDGRVGGLGDTSSEGSGRHAGAVPGAQGEGACERGRAGRVADKPVVAGAALGFWSRHDVVHCTDGKARRFEPGSFPLAHGVSNRVGRLRAYGNAIVPQVAAEFIGAWLDVAG